MKKIKLNDISNISIDLKPLDELLEKKAKDCEDMLKQISPVGVRRTRHYKDGWSYIVGEARKYDKRAIIRNVTDWQLTWLLENGHLIVNKKGGVGWSAAIPHISTAYRKISEEYKNEAEKIDFEIDFK